MNVQSGVQELDPQPDSIEGPRDSFVKVSLIDLWQIARIRWRLIAVAAGIIIALTLIGLFALTPRYAGETIVAMNEQQSNTVNIPAVITGLPSDQPTILTQVAILQSEDLASRVIAKLHLDKDPEFNPDLEPSWLSILAFLNPLHWLPNASDALTHAQRAAQAREKVVTKFLKRLEVTQVELSTAIQVDFQSEDPAKAAIIANTVADTYLEGQLDVKFDAAQKATQWLSGRLGKLAAQASAADAAVENYRVAHNLTEVVGQNGTGSISVLDQQIAQANAQLMQAETDRAAAEATAGRVAALVHAGHADQVSQVVNSPLIGQYRQQEAQLVEQQAQLASRYGPDHPKMLDLQAEKRDLEAKISQEVGNVVGTSNNDVVVARAHEAVLRESLSRLESQSGTQGKDRIELNELAANATSARMLYDTFVQRAKETEQEQGLLIPDARILSRATIPTEAAFPKKLLILAITIPAALLFGFLLAFVVERLDHGFRISARVEEVLGLPVFATLPDIGQKKGGKNSQKKSDKGSKKKAPDTGVADIVIDSPLSSYAEAIRGLQMGISLSNVDRAPKVIIVTSAIPGEGKTTTALSLARHLGQSGHKVVVVDGDLRRPTIKTSAHAQEGEFDLIDVLSGKCTLDQALIKDPKGPLLILPTVQHVKNAPDLIESKALAKVLSQLKTTFDYVIIDSAPVLPVNDTKI
jgi:polysaccharide biosynthesis transport protein